MSQIVAPEPAGGPGGVGTGTQARAPRKVGRVREFLLFALRDRRIFISLTVIVTLLLVALIGPQLREYGPTDYVGLAGQAPSAEYRFGKTMWWWFMPRHLCHRRRGRGLCPEPAGQGRLTPWSDRT